MAITRSVLRDEVRNKLRDFYLNSDPIVSNQNSSQTYLHLTDATKCKIGDLLDVENETQKITAIATNSATVMRGYWGTSAVAHISAVTTYIVDEWSKGDINQAIVDSFKALHPYIFNEYAGQVTSETNRKTLDACDAITGWTQGADGVAPVLNTSDEKEGTGCLNLGATYSAGNATYAKTISTGADITNYSYLNLWFYIEDKKDSSSDWKLAETALEIRFGSDSSNYKSITVGRDDLVTGWNFLCLNLEDFTDTGTPTTTAMDYLYIKIYDLVTYASGDLKMDEWFISTFPTTTNKFEYRLPQNIFRVHDVWLCDPDDATTMSKEVRWFVENDKLIFDVTFTDHYPIKIFGDKELTIPTADSTTIDLDDRQEELVVLASALRCFENLFGERIRFDKYSSKLNKENATILDVVRTEEALRSRYNELLSQFESAGRAMTIDFEEN